MKIEIEKSEYDYLKSLEKKIEMDDNEKMLAIEVLLVSIRGAFGCDGRIFKAKELCEELKESGWEYADVFLNSINEFITEEERSGYDGRFFRKNYKYGGYEDMKELHGFNRTTKGRSQRFLSEIYPLLPYPRFTFDDDEED